MRAGAKLRRRHARLGKTGLEAWTTDRTPEVAAFLEARGYDVVRRYVISELDVAAAPEPARAAVRADDVRRATRPRADVVRDRARVVPGPARADRSSEWTASTNGGRGDSIRIPPRRTSSRWSTAARSHTASSASRKERGGTASPRSRARRAARGVASSIKRAQLRWAKANGVEALRTANEERLVGMLAMNRRLGYRPLYTEVVLRGPLA